VQTAKQSATAALLAAVLLAAAIAAVIARRGTSTSRLASGRTGRLAASLFRATAGFAALIAAAGRLARLATAVAAAVVQAEHAVQELEAEALATQAYADY
jgi:hypothetical protein